MTLRARLTQAERRAATRAQATEPTLVLIVPFVSKDPAAVPTDPPEELVQERLAEARAAGRSVAVVFWPDRGNAQ